MHRLRIAGAGALFLLVAGSASPAWAHEHRHVGSYEFTVGWHNEPTYAGYPNAVTLLIKDAAGKPVDDIGDPPTLKVEVTTGNQKSDPLTLTPSFDPDTGFGNHGEFDGELLPTRAGVYTFRIFGTLNGQNVDEKFTSSDTTFDSPKAPTDIEFPVKDPTVGELATNIQQSAPRIDRAAAAAKSAKDKASSAGTLAVVALIVGAVIGGAGLVSRMTARRRS